MNWGKKINVKNTTKLLKVELKLKMKPENIQIKTNQIILKSITGFMFCMYEHRKSWRTGFLTN